VIETSTGTLRLTPGITKGKGGRAGIETDAVVAVTVTDLTPVVIVGDVVTLTVALVPLVRASTVAVSPAGAVAVIVNALSGTFNGRLIATFSVVVWPAQMDVGVVIVMSCACAAAGRRSKSAKPNA
jgi:hypothetical protein